jgi:chemotaxis response regulator CheB
MERESTRPRKRNLTANAQKISGVSTAKDDCVEELLRARRKSLRASDPASLRAQGSDSRRESAEEARSGKNARPVERRVIVIGGSAGSANPLLRIVSGLPKGFPAAIFIVQHRSPTGSAEYIANLLQASTVLPVSIASDLQPIETGRIYFCPSNHHLSLEDGLIRLDMSPVENHVRPSIDVLFRSAAACFGRMAVGVLLSGMLNDGTAGLWQIKRRGGVVIVQHPADAEYPEMPDNAIDNVTVDYIQPASDIAATLVKLFSYPRHSQGSSAGKPSIMIVEDEALGAQNLRERLEELGYEVRGTATSGEEAVSHAAKINPDLILMDIRLAGKMDGIEAARRIWERLQIPVVFVTGHADVETLAGVKTTENYGYLVKPFQTSSVRAAVELALNRRQKEMRLSGGVAGRRRA